VAIPKKGSRPITVDGRSYRWRIRGRPTYSQANGWAALSIAVSTDVPSSSTLVAKLTRNRPDAWINPDGTPVTPGDVASVIRHAIKVGWRPGEPGKQLNLSVEINRFRVSHLRSNNSLQRQ
jgi:hypothetical protein